MIKKIFPFTLSLSTLIHYVLVGLVLFLLIAGRADGEIILAAYDFLKPITSVIADYLFFVEIFSRSAQTQGEMTAYLSLSYLLVFVMHANVLFAVYRRGFSSPAIEQDTRLDWASYLCRYFYSTLRPSLSLHCLTTFFVRSNQQVQLHKGMSHSEVIRIFLAARIYPSLRWYYLTMIFLVFVAIPYLGWSGRPSAAFAFIYWPEVLMAIVFLQVSILIELALLVGAPLSKTKF